MSHYHLEHYVPFLFFMKIIFFVYLQKKEKYSTHALLLKCGHLTQFFYSLVFLCRKNNVGVVAIFTMEMENYTRRLFKVSIIHSNILKEVKFSQLFYIFQRLVKHTFLFKG